jgi:hypothetical protein
MPEPLIPFSESDAIVEAFRSNVGDTPTQVAALSTVIRRLPYLNAVLLRFLIQFLSQIIIYTEVNLMTADNLAIVFGPNLIRFKNPSLEILGSQIESQIVSILIVHYETIFDKIGE